MDPGQLPRSEISRRLKAARWLYGGVDPDDAEQARPIPLSVRDLAEMHDLRVNKISANMLEEIEQLKRDARPMELRQIVAALDLPPDYFGPRNYYPLWRGEFPEDVLNRIDQALRDGLLSIVDRVQALEEAVRELVDDVPVEPPGELGRDVRGLPPTSQHPERDGSSEEPGAQPGTGGA